MNLKNIFKEEAIKNAFNKCHQKITAGLEFSKVKLISFYSFIKKEVVNFKNNRIDVLGKNVKMGIGFSAIALIATVSFIAVDASNDVYQVSINGNVAGYIQDTETIKTAIDEIKSDVSKTAGGIEISIDEKAIAYKEADAKAKDVKLLDENKLKQLILSANLCKANAWAININGTNVAAVGTEKEAQSVLDGVINNYKSEGSEIVSATFKEPVELTKSAINVADIMKTQDAVNLILTGTKKPKVYTVQKGDNLWKIAKANGISPYELQESNPGFEPAKLKVGQQLNLFQIKPFVTVQLKEIVAKTEKIDFKTVYENTAALYKGEVKVKTPGVYGTKEARSEVVKENGIIVSSVELESVVTAQPQTQIALKGTKSIATFTGSGNISSPVAHIEISSAFGSRGGGRHTGVDLRNPKGTPIYAADDGVVTFASYSGSYGNIVKLSHGKGLETWYAHCDTIGVSVGQVVKKGDQIGTVGITGRATGYHLHFEVRIDGTPQNPANYL